MLPAEHAEAAGRVAGPGGGGLGRVQLLLDRYCLHVQVRGPSQNGGSVQIFEKNRIRLGKKKNDPPTKLYPCPIKKEENFCFLK